MRFASGGIVLLCTLLAPVAATAPAGEATPSVQELPGLIQKLVDAVPADPKPWQRYMSDRGVYVSESGETATKAELLEAFGGFPPGLSGSIEVRNPRISEFGDIAVVVFDAHEKQAVFDQHIEVDYINSHVWRREGGEWRLLAAQAAVRARDPQALPIDAARLQDFAGLYELSGKWRYRVAVRDGALVGGMDQREPKALIAVGDNVFAEAGSPLGILRIFVRGAGGTVERMVQRRKFADLEWRRVADATTP